MAPGQYNDKSKNYGGLHSGDGKKQHTGVYSTGVRFNVESHNKFTEGTIVYHKKTGNKGIVIPKDKKVPRSMIHIKFGNNTMYCYTSMIYREKHMEDLRRNLIHKGKSNQKKNKVTEKSKEKFNKLKERKRKEEVNRKNDILNNKKKIYEFKKAKKQFNKIIKEGVHVDISGESPSIKSIFKLPPSTNNDMIDNINKQMYQRAIQFDKDTHKNKLLTDFRIPKNRLLQLIQLTNCGSTQNLINASNKEDFYKYIESYQNYT